jgi:hypothetical protein
MTSGVASPAFDEGRVPIRAAGPSLRTASQGERIKDERLHGRSQFAGPLELPRPPFVHRFRRAAHPISDHSVHR